MTEMYELTDWMLDGEPVRVPHDAMIGERRGPDAPTGNAGAYFWGDSYRYERDIDVPVSWAGRHMELEFEGVMGRTTVLVDGHELAFHAYGYTEFTVDVTGALTPGRKARLTVVADNSEQPNSRWYAGSGIYRPVRLVVQDACRIPRGGVTVETGGIDPTWIRVRTEVEGAGEPWVRIERDGVPVAGRRGANVAVGIPDARLWSADEPNLYTCRVTLRDDDGKTLDETCVRFGIRTLDWGPDGLMVNGEPVKLRGGCVHHDNGILGAADLPAVSRRKVALLRQWGFNAIRSAHNPISRSMLDACDELGMYVMDEFADMWYQRKNPYDYARDFGPWHEADLTAMVGKDRNHPSVIMYSIGNENVEPYEDRGVLCARELVRSVHALDPTRPVTAGVNPAILFAASLGIDSFNGEAEPDSGGPGEGVPQPAGTRGGGQAGTHGGGPAGTSDGGPAREEGTERPPTSPNTSLAYNTYVTKMGDVMELMAGSWPVGRAVAPYLDELDIAGYNYATRRYRPDLRRCPDRLVFGSETMPYDLARNWRLVESDPRIIGDFMWTAWDYLGECSLAAWSDDPTPVEKPYPWLVADTAALDLIGNPTGEAALARAVWCGPAEPLLFVRPADLPHPYKAPWRGTNSVPCWSWRGAEGNVTTVEVYTRAPIAKLYLDGRHLATKRVRDFHADFRVRYEPGELTAVACTASGLELGRSSLRSAEGPLELRFVREGNQGGTGDDIAFFRVEMADAAGTVEGSCNDEVSLVVEGGELLGFGSAAQRSTCRYGTGTFPLRYGRGLAVVRMTGDDVVLRGSTTGA